MTDALDEIAALRAENAKLRESNQLLARFASQAAHDLQEPLRLLAGYLDLLRANEEGKASFDAKRIVEDAQATADRMQALVASLLDYARLTNTHRPRAPVPLAAALHDALANLKLRLQETGAQVTHGPLPTIPGDRTQLVRVFQNVVENSLKHGRASGAVIHVTQREASDAWIVVVDDNGPGWPAQGRDRLFQPFTHLNADAPGAGLGLAMVRTILEQHGGDATAAAAPGGGARIELRFPRAAPARTLEARP